MTHASTHDTVVERRHTSPQAKWLLNEVAALRGRLATVLRKRAALAAEEDKLRQRIAALELVVAPLPIPEGSLPPTSVNAQSRYGGRGRLSAALLAVLRQAGPLGASTLALRQAVAERFGVPVELTAEREHLRKLVVRRLRHLVEQGRVEKLPPEDPSKNNVVTYWRVASALPTLQELAALAGASEEASELESV